MASFKGHNGRHRARTSSSDMPISYTPSKPHPGDASVDDTTDDLYPAPTLSASTQIPSTHPVLLPHTRSRPAVGYVKHLDMTHTNPLSIKNTPILTVNVPATDLTGTPTHPARHSDTHVLDSHRLDKRQTERTQSIEQQRWSQCNVTRLSNVVIDDSEHEVQGNSSATRFPATSAAPFVPLMTHGPIAAPLISLQGTDPISSEDASVARSWPDSTQSIGVNDDTGSEVSLRGLPEACLFVASLAAVRSDTELQESVTTHFKAWGELMNVRVIKDWMGRPYAFVQFKVVEDAQRALVEANNTIIDGRHIRIEQAKVNRTLFVSKINSTLTESEVLEIAAQHGPIESLTVASSSTTNTETSGSTAHIKYRYREDAVDAFAAFRASELWSVDWASNVIDKASRDVDPFCIFVGNLNPVLVTEDLLRERFSVYGEINFINLIVRNIESPKNAAGLLRNVQHRHPRHHLLPPILGPAKGPQSFQGEVVSVVPADHLQLQYNYPPYGYNGLMMPPPHMTNYQGYGIMPYPQQGLLAASAPPPPFLMLPGNWDPATGQTRMVECPGSTAGKK
ncbi:hypothetical protein BSLG_004933 [Batrachochytrium salamandrivorans]|nr:hypothetical protein BSLG_004933 [Batrachochytrium salamandrivorans]